MLDSVVRESELQRDPTLRRRFMVYEHMLKSGTEYSLEVVLTEWVQRRALTPEQRDGVLEAFDRQEEGR
ncbi:MAG: hypothetical protein QG632_630 [Candidatus Dependentiae bacterium]|nr:hypothetical protein [Candidatus Dependentiae bacterium]